MRLSVWTLAVVVSAAIVHGSPSLAGVCTVDYGMFLLLFYFTYLCLSGRFVELFLQNYIESSPPASLKIWSITLTNLVDSYGSSSTYKYLPRNLPTQCVRLRQSRV